jgi:hypothetical protein
LAGPGGAAHRRWRGRRPAGKKQADRRRPLCCAAGGRRKNEGSRVFRVHPPFYIGPFWAGVFSTVDLRSTAAVRLAAGWATLSPGGRRRWAASPAQPSAVGPGAQAGGAGRPRAGFLLLGQTGRP